MQIEGHAADSDQDGGSCNVPRGICALLCVLILVSGLFDHDLWTPDEPREAAIALEMSRGRDWLLPRLAGEPFVEKPPLYYAAAALVLRLCGQAGPEGEAWARTACLRLTSFAWGLGALAAVWLLARRLGGRRHAALAAAALGTMPGFVQVTHWLLVDNALVFFCAAAAWAFAEAYEGRRPWFLPAAGALAASSFLAKGLVGPAIVGLGWLGLAIPWWLGKGWSGRRGAWIGAHLAAGLVFAGLAGGWMLAFRGRAGPDLFREWFVTNHFGRFAGRTANLGHISANPFEYFAILPLYVLPWLADIAAGLLEAWRRARTGGASVWMPVIWALGGLLLLSLSATKREIYLAPLLPAWAMIAARGMGGPAPRWVEAWRAGVALVCMSGLAIIGAALLAAPLVPALSSLMAVRALSSASSGAAVSAAFALSILVWRSRAWNPLSRALAIIALSYILALSSLGPVLDRHKSYGPAFASFGAKIERLSEARPADWGLDETTRAGLYYYCGMILPRIGAAAEAQAVLAGRHAGYGALVVCLKKSADGSWQGPQAVDGAQVLAEERMGRRRRLQALGPAADGNRSSTREGK